MKFDGVPDDALEAELARRKKLANMPPQPLKEPDFSGLVKTVTSGIAQSMEEGYEDDDFKHYVYEAAMEAVYGKGFWTWRNKQKW